MKKFFLNNVYLFIMQIIVRSISISNITILLYILYEEKENISRQ